MIFITAKFRVKPEHAENWPSITADFTAATRAEPGCLWFDWSRSVDDPEESGGPVVFDPTRVVDGIELSDDPILRYRAGAYSESVARRV